jgi:hypothetical protein
MHFQHDSKPWLRVLMFAGNLKDKAVTIPTATVSNVGSPSCHVVDVDVSHDRSIQRRTKQNLNRITNESKQKTKMNNTTKTRLPKVMLLTVPEMCLIHLIVCPLACLSFWYICPPVCETSTSLFLITFADFMPNWEMSVDDTWTALCLKEMQVRTPNEQTEQQQMLASRKECMYPTAC